MECGLKDTAQCGPTACNPDMVVPVGHMGILSAHAWCCISVKNTMAETNDLCKSCNSMIVSLHILCYILLIIKHVATVVMN